MIDKAILERRARVLETICEAFGVCAVVVEVTCEGESDRYSAALAQCHIGQDISLPGRHIAWAMDAASVRIFRSTAERIEIVVTAGTGYVWPVDTHQ